MENVQSSEIEKTAKISDAITACKHLNSLLEIQNDIINKNIEVHKYLRKIADKQDGILDFINSYSWLFKQVYCGFVCADRFNCELAKKYLPNNENSRQNPE